MSYNETALISGLISMGWSLAFMYGWLLYKECKKTERLEQQVIELQHERAQIRGRNHLGMRHRQ